MSLIASSVDRRKDATGTRKIIHCPGCGMMRLLPYDLKFGDKLSLVPCIKCGSAGPKGRYLGKFVWSS